MRLGPLALVIALLVAAPRPACAQGDAAATRAEARAHFDRGTDLFNEGLFDAALAEFQRAYDVEPAYPVLYNLGLVEAERGRPVEAAHALERYLAEGGDAISASRQADVRALLARQRERIGRVSVESNVAGSIVSVDGIDVTTTPLAAPIELGAGMHTLGVRAPGHESVARALQIAGGVEAHVRVDLRPQVEPRGTLRISASVPDTVVSIDGAEIGTTPLDATVPVPAGAHLVTGERPGYVGDERQVVVEDGAELEVRLRLDPDPAADSRVTGILSLELPAVPFTVRVDGDAHASTERLTLPMGGHRIEIDAGEREPWSGDVRLEAGETVVLAPPLAWRRDVREARLAAAEGQRTTGIGLLVAGLALVAVALPVVVWNETEIARTDARGMELERQRVMRGCLPGACRDIDDELDAITTQQVTQDIIRGVSIAGTLLGGVLGGIGVALFATTPSREGIDRAAHVRLHLGPGGLRLDGTF